MIKLLFSPIKEYEAKQAANMSAWNPYSEKWFQSHRKHIKLLVLTTYIWKQSKNYLYSLEKERVLFVGNYISKGHLLSLLREELGNLIIFYYKTRNGSYY